jgi:hypothetical protein
MPSPSSPRASRCHPSSSPATTCSRRNLARVTRPRWRPYPPWSQARHPHHQLAHHYLHQPRRHLPHTCHPRTLARTTTKSARPTTTRRSLHLLPATMPQRQCGPRPSTRGPVLSMHGRCQFGVPRLPAYSALNLRMCRSRRSPRRRSSPMSTLITKLLWSHGSPSRCSCTNSVHRRPAPTWPIILVFYALLPHLL